MRIAAISAILAIPLVAAAAVDHRPHAAALRRMHRRAELENRGLVILGQTLIPDPTSTADSSVAPTTAAPSSHSVQSSVSVPVSVPTSSATGAVGPASPSPKPSSESSAAASSPSISPSPSPSTAAKPSEASSASSEHPSPSPSPEPSPEPSPSPSPTEEPTSQAPEPTSDTADVNTITVSGVVKTVTVEAAVTSSAAASAAAVAKSEGLSKGAIIGIAVGASVGGILLILGILFGLFRKRHNDDEPMRWPELNRHGDTPAHHAVPVSRTSGHGVDERRISLGDELDGPSMYAGDVDPGSASALNGSSFGSAAMLDYDEKAVYPPAHPGFGFDDHTGEYTSYPPPVQPQPESVHGTPYDWESSDGGAYSNENGYSGMTRQTSPTMAGVGAPGMTFPQPQVPHGSHPHY